MKTKIMEKINNNIINSKKMKWINKKMILLKKKIKKLMMKKKLKVWTLWKTQIRLKIIKRICRKILL